MANRIIALVMVLIAIGVAVAVSWFGLPRSRAHTSGFLASLAAEPIVAGALEAAGSHETPIVVAGRSEVRFWKRRYDDVSWTVTARLAPESSPSFLRAVRDSLERRLESAGATIRGVDTTQWPDSSVTRMEAPAALTLPYATRRNAGWVTIHAAPARDEASTFTMWLAVHEGPKPRD
jgi:hypothetical protein